jgi:hypothetical protein
MAKDVRGEIAPNAKPNEKAARTNIKVRATREGLYGIVRQRFEVFIIAKEADFSKRWMEEVADNEDVTRPELTAEGVLRDEAKVTAKRPVPNIKDVSIAGADNVESKEPVRAVEEKAHAEVTPQRRQRQRAGSVTPAVHD